MLKTEIYKEFSDLSRSITGSGDEEVLIRSKGETHDVTGMTSE